MHFFTVYLCVKMSVFCKKTPFSAKGENYQNIFDIVVARGGTEMIESIVSSIVCQMEEEGYCNREEQEYYVYALITLSERSITVLTILGIALISKNMIPTILFLIFFFSLRRRTNGYHAEKFWQCYLGTTITYIAIILISPILAENKKIMFGIVVASVILILSIGTVNHPNMSMNHLELRSSKRAARYVLILECLVVGTSYILNVCEMCTSYMAIAIILCAVLLGSAKILKQEVR